MKTKYKHIFFDLDRTLWDLEKNSEQALFELYHYYRLEEYGITDFSDFIKKYNHINHLLWQTYSQGKITKEELRFQRFNKLLNLYAIQNATLSKSLGEMYTQHTPNKPHLFPFAKEVLEYLYSNYNLHIITNGFIEVQHIKLRKSGIDNYFQKIILSEIAGFSKPNIEIFNFAFKETNATPHNSIMIGDDLEADIIGAKNAEIDQIYFNPLGNKTEINPTYEITCLSELKKIL
jgi:putative hydrolase of the HAD superfamily